MIFLLTHSCPGIPEADRPSIFEIGYLGPSLDIRMTIMWSAGFHSFPHPYLYQKVIQTAEEPQE